MSQVLQLILQVKYMSNIKSFIDDCIVNKSYSDHGLFARISERVKVFKEAKTKGSLNPSSYKGIDRLVADRVMALFSVETTTDITVPTLSTASATTKGTAYYKLIEDEGLVDGYVVWAGNEAYICPWLVEFISNSSSDTSSNRFTPTQSLKFSKFCNGIPFNSTQVLTDQNRQIALTANLVAKFSKSARKITIGLVNDKDAFTSDGASGSPINTIDLNDSLPSGDLWCIGKILHLKDYLFINIYKFPNARAKDRFERPRWYANNNDDAQGSTVDAILLCVNTNSCKVTKLDVGSTTTQTKLNVIRGYTDFIVHMDKLYTIRSKATPVTVNWEGFGLKTVKDTPGLVKDGKRKYALESYTFEIVEVKLDPAMKATIVHVADVKPPPPESAGKFGITGSKIAYVTAKLAASELNPYTFYVQQFYELVFQLPYNYDMKYSSQIYWETGIGKRMRTDSTFHDWIMSGDATTSYASDLITPLAGITCGMITKIIGQIYLEIPTKLNNDSYTVQTSDSNSDAIYELVGEGQPCISPVSSDWSMWYRGTGASALDLWIVWHLVSNALGTGSAKSKNIVAELELTIFENKHPFALEIEAKRLAKEPVSDLASRIAYWPWEAKTKWCYSLTKKPGTFSFPYEKWFNYGGGNRGTTSYGVSGYDSWGETFLVTYAGDKFPVDGVRTKTTARPVLVIAGVGPYAEIWGAIGWGDQMTQSPLVVECWNYQTVNKERMSIFNWCNSETQPDVYMQANETVMGTIGNFWTGWDLTDPTIQLLHGMYPIAQNGITINENKESITTNTLNFTDMRISMDNKRQIYYSLFSYASEYNTTAKKYELNNYYLESRAYECKLVKQTTSTSPNDSMLDFWAAKAIAYWWSKKAPAVSTDPVPWWGPCQMDLHIKL